MSGRRSQTRRARETCGGVFDRDVEVRAVLFDQRLQQFRQRRHVSLQVPVGPYLSPFPGHDLFDRRHAVLHLARARSARSVIIPSSTALRRSSRPDAPTRISSRELLGDFR